MNPLPTHQTGRADVGASSPAGGIRRLLDTLLQGSTIPCRIVFSNGAEYRNGAEAPAFTIIFRRHRDRLEDTLFGFG